MEKIKASPGLALIEPIIEKSESGITITSKKEGRIIKGKIIKMGNDDLNNYGTKIEAKNYGKEGDIIYFLSYYEEGGYDQVKIEGVNYYLVKWGDFRLNLG